MRVCKPATPGFLFNLSATALLAVVSFSVPYFKSIYFLKAAITQSGVAGSVTFGVLGYCLDFNNQITCSKPSVGWEFDPNQLLGNDLPIQIPNVVVKWLTYALVTHIVAMGLAGVSTVFSLLAHVREITMTCFSSCISGMAAAVALIAFIFDLVVFFVVRARVNSIQGGAATIGNGLWMTLAAWALLFFSGCVAVFGRCCVSGKSSGGRRKKNRDIDTEDSGSSKFDRESDRMRLDAVKAEADRKRQQAEQREGGLPAFYEYERTPLKRDEPQYYEEEVEVVAPYSDRPRRDGSTRTVGGAGGARAYQPAAPGTRTVDDYYNNSAPAANTYPPQPQPQRQPSQASQRTYQTQTATPPTRFQSPPVPPLPSNFVDPYSTRAVDPYLAVATAGAGAGAYGHQAESSYSNLSAHQQYPSGQQYPSPGHQQYPSAGHEQYPSGQQYSSPPPQQDPYALSSYNPGVATMSPPQPTHYQDHSQGYDQQAYAQQRGYDAQQEYNHAAQQMYAQPEPQRADPGGYDPYGQAQRQPSYDQYNNQGYDPYGQAQRQPSYDQYNNQGYDPYGQQPYVQEPYPQEPYAQPQPTRQQTYDQNRSLVASPSPLVASPSPITSPPEVNTAVAAQAGPSSHAWSEESPSEAPPPQYEPMAGAAGAAAATATGYPREKR